MSADAPASNVLAVIPARLHSQRLPRKLLRLIAGKPLLFWTYQAALACPQLGQPLVAVDSEEIAALCRLHGWPYRMTSPDLASGTDRLYAVSREVDADIYVNLQGDEPLVSPHHIAALLAAFTQSDVEAATLKLPCAVAEAADPNVVKVVTDLSGRALYFSRAAIPFDRDGTGPARLWKHMGLYAYRRGALARFATLPPSPLEQLEKLEQLRLLENGLPLQVSEVSEETVGVDTEADLLRVESLLQRRWEGSSSPLSHAPAGGAGLF